MDFDSLPSDTVSTEAAPTTTPNMSVDSSHGVIQQPHAEAPAQHIDFDALQSDEEKYGTPEQMVKTGLEGFGKGFAGAAAPYIETKLGISPEDIRNREEVNPITHGVTEAGGLATGLLTGTGEAAMMTKAGELASGLMHAPEAAELAGVALKAPSYIHRVGSEAVKQAAEMAILQSNDEIAKHILKDPKASAESAIANIGLASAFGAGTGAFVSGAVSPLWKATVGPKVEGFLNGMVSKLGGREGDALVPELASKAGVNIPAEIAGQLDGTPLVKDIASKLGQTDTSVFGRKYQGVKDTFEKDLTNAAAATLGKDAETIKNPIELDKYTVGKEAGDTLHDSIKEQYAPIKDSYSNIEKQFKDAELTPENIKITADAIAKKAIDENWAASINGEKSKFLTQVLDKLPEQKTASDLKQFMTDLREAHPFGSPTYQASKELRNIIQESQERAIEDGIIRSGGNSQVVEQTLESYKQLKNSYKGLMNTIEDLNEHVHVGKYYGPESFLKALKDKASDNGEGILRSLSGSSKANVLDLLAKHSPETLEKIKQYHVDNLINSARRANGVNASSILSKINDKNLSPQVRNLIAGPEQQERLKAIGEIVRKLYDPNHNWSNTARTIDKLTHSAISPLTMLAGMFGHGGDAIMAHLGSLGLKEGGDYLRYSLLKLLGSGNPLKPEAFHAMNQFITNAAKGQVMMKKAADGVFKSGAAAIIAIPSAKELAKLDKLVVQNQKNPEETITKVANGHTGYYLPDHQTSLTQTAVGAMQYLSGIKPEAFRPSPLDQPIEPGPMEMARYNRALTIAQQPLTVLHHVKEGTILPTDIADLNGMYPGMYQQMTQQVTDAMINRKSDEMPIPYKTRMGVSLFLGQPIDSTMHPQSIMSAQPVPKPQGPQQGQGMKKGSPSALKNPGKNYQTPGQASEADRSSRD